MTPAAGPCTALLLALCLAGCAATKPPERPAVLRAQPSFPSMPPAGPQASIAVAPVSASGAAGERRYSYIDRAAPREVRQAATLFWEEPPPRMVERALVDGLGARFGAVSPPETPAVAEQRVTVRLRRFEELTGGGQPTEAVVAFDAAVTTPERRLILAGAYCAAADVQGAAGSDRALAFESALRTAVTRLAADLAAGKGSVSGC